jgi:signal transduction histidine kinase
VSATTGGPALDAETKVEASPPRVAAPEAGSEREVGARAEARSDTALHGPLGGTVRAWADLGVLPAWPVPLSSAPLRARGIAVDACVRGLALGGDASSARFDDVALLVERIIALGVRADELRALACECIVAGVAEAGRPRRKRPRGSTAAYAMLLEIRLAEVGDVLEARARAAGRGRVDLELRVAETAHVHPAVWAGLAGLVEGLPATRGQPPARVEILPLLDGAGVRLRVDFCPGAGWLTRALDRLRGRLDALAFAPFPRLHDARLARAHGALRAARRQLRLQADVLRERDEWWRAALESSAALVVLVDARGRPLATSRSVRRKWGLGAERGGPAHDASLFAAVAPIDRESAQVAFTALVNGGPARTARVRSLSMRGRLEWTIAHAQALRGPHGEPQVLIVARPDTMPARRRSEPEAREVERRTRELETAQAELRVLVQRLIAAERLRATSRLAGTVGDAIKTPLDALARTAALLRTEQREPNERLDRVIALASRIRGVVDRTLELAREEAIDLTLQEPAAVLHDLSEELDPLCKGRGVALVLVSEGSLPRVFADRTLLRTGLVAVAENAAQMSPPGSEVRIGARSRGDRRTVEFYVEDCGPGISEELREKIFDAFFTTRDGGTGLGLAIAKLVAKRHEGSIRMEPREGGGTRATLEIPAVPSPPAPLPA